MTQFRHGTLNGYILGGCRCRACCAAVERRQASKSAPSGLAVVCCETEALEVEGSGHDEGCPGPLDRQADVESYLAECEVVERGPR